MIKILKKIKQEWKNIIFNTIFACLTLLFIILFYKKIYLAVVFISLLTIGALIKWKAKMNIMIFVFGAVIGVLSEMTAIYFGVWTYAFTNFYNIPFWVFLAWGNTALYIYQTTIELKKLGVKK